MPSGHDSDDDDKDDNDGNDGGDGVLMPAEKALQSKILGSSCMFSDVDDRPCCQKCLHENIKHFLQHWVCLSVTVCVLVTIY